MKINFTYEIFISHKELKQLTRNFIFAYEIACGIFVKTQEELRGQVGPILATSQSSEVRVGKFKFLSFGFSFSSGFRHIITI